jgi:hypothetical protein
MMNIKDSKRDAWLKDNPLRQWREAQKPQKSLDDVGKACGKKSRMSVSFWEQGTFWPKPKNMAMLAKLMGVNSTTLYSQWAQWKAAEPAIKRAKKVA